MARIQPMSKNRAEKLIRAYLSGDKKAEKEIISATNQYSKIANSRMRSLEKAGYDMFTYDRASAALMTLNRSRFKESWNDLSASENVEDLILSFRETRQFISMEQSTVSGAKNKMETFLEQMDTYGWIDRSTLSENTQKELVHLMGDGGLRELIAATYENVEDVLSTITDELEQGTTYSEISEKIDAILTGTLDYDDFFKVFS